MVDPERWPAPFRDAVRTFNKRALNPVMMSLAGSKYWYAGTVQHVGRRSGKRYTTPVVANRIPGGFLIPLTYGRDVDWLRNVLAAGQATVTAKGQTYQVAGPEVISAETAFPMLTRGWRTIYRRGGVAHFLKVGSAPSDGLDPI
jgi:deazaflavin-dependent oxidoreductase (nitroreductase family)